MQFSIFILFLLTLSTLTLPAGITLAQTDNASSSQSTSTVPEVTPIAPVVPSKHTVAFKPRTQQRIINLAANISNRFDAIIARLENISSRLQARIEKLHQDGTDTSAAQTSLENARTALRAAKEQMNGIDAAVMGAIGSTDPKKAWQPVRTKFLMTRDNIRVAHTELKNTIDNLKNAPPAVPQNQSTTTDTLSAQSQ